MSLVSAGFRWLVLIKTNCFPVVESKNFVEKSVTQRFFSHHNGGKKKKVLQEKLFSSG